MLLVYRFVKDCVVKAPLFYNLNNYTKNEVLPNYQNSCNIIVKFFYSDFTFSLQNQITRHFRQDFRNLDESKLILEVIKCRKFDEADTSKIERCKTSRIQKYFKKEKKCRECNKKKIKKFLLTGEYQFSPTKNKFSRNRYTTVRRSVLLNNSRLSKFSSVSNSTDDTNIMAKIDSDVLVNANVVNATEEPNLQEIFRKIRQEECTPYGKYLKYGWLDSRAKRGVRIKVLSYNILAQNLLEMHPDLYLYHDSQYLSWNYRSEALIKEFAEFDADILCLQEVEAAKLDFFDRELKRLGYRGMFKKRTHDKEDGCAIYFRENAFEVREFVSVEYYQPNVSVLDRDNIGMILRLSPKEFSNKQLVVANTHLLFNPRRQDIKLAQTQVMLAEIDRVAFKCTNAVGEVCYHPVILTGDFNSDPHTYVYNLLVNGWLEVQGPSILPSSLGIMDTCQHVDVAKNRPFIRNETSDFKYVKLFNSDCINLQSPDLQAEHCRRNDYGQSQFHTGLLRHNLNLISVYQRWDMEAHKRTATTFHNRWCTVDYIFYGPNRIYNNQPVEGELKLVSYLRLPSTVEAAILKGIPNEICASDHLPLLATFHLPADL